MRILVCDTRQRALAIEAECADACVLCVAQRLPRPASVGVEDALAAHILARNVRVTARLAEEADARHRRQHSQQNGRRVTCERVVRANARHLLMPLDERRLHAAQIGDVKWPRVAALRFCVRKLLRKLERRVSIVVNCDARAVGHRYNASGHRGAAADDMRN